MGQTSRNFLATTISSQMLFKLPTAFTRVPNMTPLRLVQTDDDDEEEEEEEEEVDVVFGCPIPTGEVVHSVCAINSSWVK